MADDTLFAEQTAPLSFAEFLERMKEPAAADLVRSIKNFIKTFDDRPPDPERDALSVQSFLVKSEAAFKQHPVWASVPPIHQAQAVEGLEKYLMTKIYHKVFAVSELDRERDESVTMRMSALGFIEPKHLDIPELYHDEKSWILARKELHKINNYKAPRDKLVCVLNCCRVINNLLHVQVHGEARGADDFLPVLIYVVIHANPPQLASNLEYIQRFRMHSRMASESAYFFTQLYSAASFIETVNATSLTIDPDEFMARMVAAGIPDMQLVPSSNAPALMSRTSNSNIADALALSKKGPALVGQGLPGTEPAGGADLSAVAGAPLAVPGLQQDGPAPGEAFLGIPAGAALPTRAVPLSGKASTGMLPTHSGGIVGAIPEAHTQLTAAEPAHLIAPALVAADAARPDPSAVEVQSATYGQHMPAGGAAAAAAAGYTAGAPAAVPQPSAERALHGTGQSVTAGVAAPQSRHYPSVADLEVAGTALVLEAEASGRLKEQHTFLYAMAGDLRVVDVSKLLSQYKELVLRYEALSLAVAQLHMQTQAEATMQPAAFSSAQASQQSMPAIAQQLQYAVGSGTDSPSHLVASRQPEKAHEPMFGAAQPLAEAASAQGTSALLQEASDTAHEAAEAVLKPQTSESYYSEEPSSEAAVQPDKGSSVAAHPAGDEDQFLSLANGEAQADAPDVGKGHLTGSGAHNASTSQPQRGPATDPQAASNQRSGALHETAEEEAQPVSGHAGANEGEQDAPGAVMDTPAVEPAADQEPSLQHLGSLPSLPAPPRAAHRQSISSTAATVAEDDAESLAAQQPSSPEQDTRPPSAASARSAFADPASDDRSAASGAAGAGAREAQSTSREPGPEGVDAGEHATAERSGQPGATSESWVSSATANGSSHGAATSNDVDPFAETDAALHGNRHPQPEEGNSTDAQHHDTSADAKAKIPEEMPEDLFGGLTLSKANEGSSLI